jgi:hypothetical protein
MKVLQYILAYRGATNSSPLSSGNPISNRGPELTPKRVEQPEQRQTYQMQAIKRNS